MRIAIIGMGEVGCTFIETLNAKEPIVSRVADKKLSARAQCLCQQLSVDPVDDAGKVIDDHEILLSCVEGETAEIIADLLAQRGHTGQVLIDFSTASADAKKRSAAKLHQVGIEYVDVAIMGAIALTGSNTSMIAAGVAPASVSEQAITMLEQGGLNISSIPDSQAGDAISLKLLRSIFTKGLEALTTECLAAAEYLGVRHALYEVLSDIDRTPLPEFLEMLVRTHVVHAARRKKEVQRAHEQMTNLGLDSLMLPAIEAVFARTENKHVHDSSSNSPDAEQALQLLIDICRQPATHHQPTHAA